MADTKISALTAIGAVADEDLIAVVDDPSGTPTTTKATVTQLRTQLQTGWPAELGVACTNETTAVTTTGTKATFRMPYAMTVTDVRASLSSACTTGTFTVDINDGGTTILSTKLTIDATEKTSETAAAAAVISDSALADDAEITIDVDDVGDSTATGLKVWIIGTRA